MLSYTALLVASLVVAAVAFFLYKVISDSSRSVFSSKNGIALIDGKQAHNNDPVSKASLAYKPSTYGAVGRSSAQNFAGTVPAKPTESTDINWGWGGSGVQLREPGLQTANGATGNSKHCSLYDSNLADSRPDHPNPYTGRLHREEKNKTVGRTYKVTRKTQTAIGSDGDLNKPWGW
ncbi:MAG: hypothetical protein WBS20_12920 [Lysobacterales bacterium]